MSEIQFILDKEKCIGADECDGACARICPPDIIEYAEEEGKKIPVVTDMDLCMKDHGLSLIHISEPTRPPVASRMPSSA